MVKVTEFSEDTSPTGDDLLMGINDPTGTPASRKWTLDNTLNYLLTRTQTWTGVNTFSANISMTGANAYFDIVEITTPANPAANTGRLYVKDDATVTKLYFRDSAGTETDLLAGGAGGHTIKEEGTPLTARAGLNFVGGIITATDDVGNNETDVTISGTKSEFDATLEDGTFAFLNQNNTFTVDQNLSNGSHITWNGSTLRSIRNNGGVMEYEVPTGQFHRFNVNGVDFWTMSSDGVSVGSGLRLGLSNSTDPLSANTYLIDSNGDLQHRVGFAGDKHQFFIAGTETFTIDDGWLGMAAGHEVFFDGIAGTGNTSIRESVADTITIKAGGQDSLHVFNDGNTAVTIEDNNAALDLNLTRTDATPTDNTEIAELHFKSNTDLVANFIYGKIITLTRDVTDVSASGQMEIGVANGGNWNRSITLDGNANTIIMDKVVNFTNKAAINTGNLAVTDANNFFTAAQTIDVGALNSNLTLGGNNDLADSTVIGKIDFNATEDTGGVPVEGTYGRIDTIMLDDTTATENSEMRFSIYYNGVFNEFFNIGANFGYVNVVNTSFTVPTGQRVYVDGGSDTGIYESAADQLSLEVGGTDALTAKANDVDFNRHIVMANQERIYFEAGKQSWIAEEVADGVWINVGGEAGLRLVEVGTEVNVVCGANNVLATTATNGFLYIPEMNGVPTGTPTGYTGKAPIVFNESANELYLRHATGWMVVGHHYAWNQSTDAQNNLLYGLNGLQENGAGIASSGFIRMWPSSPIAWRNSGGTDDIWLYGAGSDQIRLEWYDPVTTHIGFSNTTGLDLDFKQIFNVTYLEMSDNNTSITEDIRFANDEGISARNAANTADNYLINNTADFWETSSGFDIYNKIAGGFRKRRSDIITGPNGTIGNNAFHAPDGTAVYASGTVTCASVLAGDTVTINGLVYTGVTGVKANNTQFSVDTSDTACATDLADSITNDVRTGTERKVHPDATSSVAVVTVTSDIADGTLGNVTLASSNGTRLAVSGATLTGGAGVITNYARFIGKVESNTDGAEEGSLEFVLMEGGNSSVTYMDFNNAGNNEIDMFRDVNIDDGALGVNLTIGGNNDLIDGNVIGNINFNATEDTGGTPIEGTFAKIDAVMGDDTTGTEDGWLRFSSYFNGTLTEWLNVGEFGIVEVKNGGLAIGFQDNLWLDAGFNTYIVSDVADQIHFICGGVSGPSINDAGDLMLQAADRLRFDGSFTGDTYIEEPSSDNLIITVGGQQSLALDENGTEVNVVPGKLAALATTATDGFLYIPTMAGDATGTPTSYTGKTPIAWDSTNNELKVYSGGAWRTVASVAQ